MALLNPQKMKESEMRAAKARTAQMGQSEAQMEQRRAEQAAREEQRRAVVRSVLEPEALERLNRIGLVKPEKQEQLEEIIFVNVQKGAIRNKIDEGTFVSLLQQIGEGPGVAAGAAAKGISFKRRAFEDDSDIDLDNLE